MGVFLRGAQSVIDRAWRLAHAKEIKASTVGPLISLHHLGRAVWTPRQYDKLAAEGYQNNVIAYRAITEVTRAVASVPWKLFRQVGADRAELDEHPLLKLRERPNPTMGGSEFIEAVTGYLMISGNSYVESIGPDNGAPDELWPLRPDRMRVVPSDTGMPAAYVYTVGGRTQRWEFDPIKGLGPVLHERLFHPLNDWYGMSPLEAAARSVDQHNASGDWNVALLQNSARPSGAMVYAPKDGPANLTDEQHTKLSEQIDLQYKGKRNAGRPMLLDGGLSWQAMSLNPKDMEFMDGRNMSSRDIALAFGVPPQLLGIPGDNTYSNYQEARLALWEETVLPLVRHHLDEFNNWLVPMFGEDLEFDADLDGIPALAIRRQATWERVEQSSFMTINEKRQAVGLDDIEGGDVVLVSAAMLPLGAEVDDDEDSGTPEERRARFQLAYGDPAPPVAKNITA